MDEIGRLDTLLAEHIDHFHQSGVSAAQWRDYTAAMAEAPLLDPTLQLKSRYLLCIRDLRGRFVKLSQSWEANLDFRLSELQGAPLLRLVHPADVWATHDRMEAVRSGRGAGGFSNRYRRRSGGYRRLEWTSRLFGDLVYGVAHDVTELVGAEDL
ncbi:PAS domain-containing protein [Phenylobacterium montanum]|uniref:PAS domain-containing protein n=1 Tax=Phenylobacterium montanum TaxID=2823693 RepID=A0A975G050_9CAUL|nr:PAS domain-containing protein [Caulobacter sp. S6]QUD88465.1 PAS domain-containing protein [Caulobacter sp. S6]